MYSKKDHSKDEIIMINVSNQVHYMRILKYLEGVGYSYSDPHGVEYSTGCKVYVSWDNNTHTFDRNFVKDLNHVKYVDLNWLKEVVVDQD